MGQCQVYSPHTYFWQRRNLCCWMSGLTEMFLVIGLVKAPSKLVNSKKNETKTILAWFLTTSLGGKKKELVILVPNKLWYKQEHGKPLWKWQPFPFQGTWKEQWTEKNSYIKNIEYYGEKNPKPLSYLCLLFTWADVNQQHFMELHWCKMSGQSELAQTKTVETFIFSSLLGRKDKIIWYIKKNTGVGLLILPI